MKRLFISIFFFIFLAISSYIAVNAHAGMVIGDWYSAAVDACSACPSDTYNGDVLCEDFDATGSLCTLADNVGGTNTWDADNSHTGTYNCNDSGLYDLKVIWTYDQGQACKRFDIGSEKSSIFVRFDFYITSVDLDSSNSLPLITMQNASGFETVSIELYNDSGTYKLKTSYWNGSGLSAVTGSTEITTATWRTVTVEWVSGSKI